MNRQAAMQTMAAVSLEALRNAARLRDDAELLFKAGRYPSAFMLIGLSADELGKHVMVTAFAARGGSDVEWRKLWRRLRSHEEKLGTGLLGAWLGDLDTDEPLPTGEDLHTRRLAATYVDFKPDGTVATPEFAVNATDVREALDLIGREITFLQSVLQDVDAERLAHFFENLLAEGDRAAVEDLVDDPTWSMALGIGWRSGIPVEHLREFADTAATVFRQAMDADSGREWDGQQPQT